MTIKRLFFFKGSEYYRFDVADDRVPSQYPRQIAGPWPGMFADGVDAGFPVRTGKAYFFRGAEYLRYDVILDRTDTGYPKPIAGNWPGVGGTGFENGIDAALNWGNGQFYWFRGDQYLRLSFTAGTGWAVDSGYPKPIAGNWPGVSGTGFENGIDGAVNWGDNRRYWFKGDLYLRLSDGASGKTVDSGYPKPMAGNWNGVPTDMSGCLEWPLAQVVSGTFAVPTLRGGWTGPMVQADGTNRWGESFEMHTDFVSEAPNYPVMCGAGEYRQYVRGSFMLQDPVIGALRRINHDLPDMVNGGVMPMLAAPAAGAAGNNFLEDGHAGGRWQYGHRREPAANPGPHNQFLPDRDTGCEYRGTDFPSLGWTPGTPYSVSLDFRGQAVDSATAGEVLVTNDWSVSGSGVL